MNLSRSMWRVIEPLHAILYYAPEVTAEAEQLGYAVDTRWPSYFAWRAAPLGPAGPAAVTSAFYSFSPRMVATHIPATWQTSSPNEVLSRRWPAIDRAMRRLLEDPTGIPRKTDAAPITSIPVGSTSEAMSGAAVGSKPEAINGVAVDSKTDTVDVAPVDSEAAAIPNIPGKAAFDDDTDIAEAAALARKAAESAPTTGRPLAAANLDLGWPDEPHLILWQAATVLREHRGDGHIAAALTLGFDPRELLVSLAATGAVPAGVFASRGWTPDEWQAAEDRLKSRGWLNPDGTPTPTGEATRAELESRTDDLAAAPWQALGPAAARFAQLAGPLASRIATSGLLPRTSTLALR